MSYRFVAAVMAVAVLAGCSHQAQLPEQEAFLPDIDNLAACAPNLSMDQVIVLLRDTRDARGQAIPQTQWVTGAAIAKAELGLCSDATNNNTNGSIDYGLFQINSIHPYDDADPTRLFEPSYNTVAAIEIYNDSGSWRPWSTYNASRYTQFLGEAQAAYDRVVGGEGPPPPTCEIAWGTVRAGERGSVVSAVQYLLNARGGAVVADGVFGPNTQAAVAAFQGTSGLVADGIVGPQTWAALTAGYLVKEGDGGEAVKAVQVVVGTATDGIFGPGTRNAVAAFQTGNSLIADSVVGQHTWAAISGGRGCS